MNARLNFVLSCHVHANSNISSQDRQKVKDGLPNLKKNLKAETILTMSAFTGVQGVVSYFSASLSQQKSSRLSSLSVIQKNL